MEPGEIKRYYKWNSGPFQNTVECYNCEDESFVWFDSGNNVSKELLEVNLHSSNAEEYSRFSSAGSFNQAPIPKLDIEAMLGNPVRNSIEPPTPKVQKEKSAILIILEKQKKFSNRSITIDIPFDFPNDKSLEFMSMMFDEDEILDEVADFVYSQLTLEKITDHIKDTIKDTIKAKLITDGE